MYVPWIHGDAPTPMWWMALCSSVTTEGPWPPAWLKREQDDARTDLLRVLRTRAESLGEVDWQDPVLLVPWPTEYP